MPRSELGTHANFTLSSSPKSLACTYCGLLLCQVLLLKEGVFQVLSTVLGRSFASNSDGKQSLDSRNLAKFGFTILSWCLPVFKSFSLFCYSRTSTHQAVRHDL